MGFQLLPPSKRPTIDKDPDASLRYGIDVAGLLQAGDSLASAAVQGTPVGVTAGSASYSGTVISVRVSGGVVGDVGSVTLRWTTTQGDTDERTLYFNVLQR
jgi:hypothetical protein